MRGILGRPRGATVWVLLTAAALIGALLIETVPGWLHLWAEDGAAAAGSIRIALLIVAAVLLFIAMSFGYGFWVDTFVATAVLLTVVAAAASYIEARPKNEADGPEVTFTLPAAAIDATGLAEGDDAAESDVVLLVVLTEQGENGKRTFTAQRYEAVLDAAYVQNNDLPIRIERGTKDANAVSFVQSLAQVSQVYVLSPA